MQWLDIRLQMIGVIVVTGIGVIAIIQHQFKSIDPGEQPASVLACVP
jgi:ATP-binding cassette subfamily C (CFTR/MRP) protein 10